MRALIAAPAASANSITFARSLANALHGLVVSVVSIIALVSLRRPAVRLASGAAGR